jgi:lipopolysaccharide transport system permease protein
VLAVRDIKVRYKQAVIGAACAVVQPLMMVLMFTLVFDRLANVPSDGVPYPVFALAGLLAWQFFASCVNGASVSLIGSASLLSKIYFPQILLPLSVLGIALLDLAIAGVVLMMLIYGMTWRVSMLALPLLIVIAGFTVLGVGTLMAALTVTYRNFRFGVQLWMFASPVIYPSSLVPAEWR